MAKSNKTRRPYGAGSITPAGDGKWLVRACHGRKADGSPRRVQRTVRGDKATAERALVKLQTELDARPNLGDTMTVDEYFEDVFVPVRGKLLAKRTLDSYKSIYRTHIKPAFGDVPADQIGRADVQRWVLGLPTPSAADKGFRHLRLILRAMWADELLDEEPLRRPVKLPPHQVEPAEVWTTDELMEAVERLRGHRLEGLVLAMGGGGLRREEALGLDLPGDVAPGVMLGPDGVPRTVCRLVIRKAWTDGGPQKELTKTYRIRPVTIGEPFAERFAEVALDGRPKLLLRLDGRPLQPSSVGETWEHAFGARGPLHGMRRVEIRTLRHCHETIAARGGTGDSVNADVHGHGQLVMYRNYLSLGSDDADQVAEAVRSVVVPAPLPKGGSPDGPNRDLEDAIA